MNGIARNTATKNASLKGVMNGEITPVAMSVPPLGSLSMSGWATAVKISFLKNAQGRNITSTTTSARISRVRSSSRCEISVPEARVSGSSLMRVLRWGRGVGRGVHGLRGFCRRISGCIGAG
jgi:hypothetical protein